MIPERFGLIAGTRLQQDVRAVRPRGKGWLGSMGDTLVGGFIITHHPGSLFGQKIGSLQGGLLYMDKVFFEKGPFGWGGHVFLTLTEAWFALVRPIADLSKEVKTHGRLPEPRHTVGCGNGVCGNVISAHPIYQMFQHSSRSRKNNVLMPPSPPLKMFPPDLPPPMSLVRCYPPSRWLPA